MIWSNPLFVIVAQGMLILSFLWCLIAFVVEANSPNAVTGELYQKHCVEECTAGTNDTFCRYNPRCSLYRDGSYITNGFMYDSIWIAAPFGLVGAVAVMAFNVLYFKTYYLSKK